MTTTILELRRRHVEVVIHSPIRQELHVLRLIDRRFRPATHDFDRFRSATTPRRQRVVQAARPSVAKPTACPCSGPIGLMVGRPSAHPVSGQPRSAAGRNGHAC